MILFGGSIMCGGEVLAQAMQNNIAKKYVIVGGAGHTTETLREIAHFYAPQINTFNKSEAEIFNEYIYNLYGVKADYTETKSTNCGKPHDVSSIVIGTRNFYFKNPPCTSLLFNI